jgi:hypothetical protein
MFWKSGGVVAETRFSLWQRVINSFVRETDQQTTVIEALPECLKIGGAQRALWRVVPETLTPFTATSS